jgi:hypothetical protein
MKKSFLYLISSMMLLTITSCEIESAHITEPTINEENGHEFVDLGLSVRWATMNVGAVKPEEFGSYFAWGETLPKETYTEESYTYKATTQILPLSDDAARVNWGGRWRMPNPDELMELIENCNWTYTYTPDLNLYGYKVTSKINGKSIFLPTAEVFSGDKITSSTMYGYGAYWTSSTYFPQGYDYISALFFYQGHVDLGALSPYWGLPIRAVLPVGDDIKTVRFDANGAQGSMNPIKVEYSKSTQLPSNAFVKEGYEFLGWDTKADGTGTGYGATAYIATITDVTLYAQWIKKDISGNAGGFDYVDMGLPSGTKWALYNVGAKNRWESGAPYAWGETHTKASYTEKNYTYTDRPATLPLAHDAAHVNWGGVWRMPTEADFNELIEHCTFTPLNKYDHQGYIITSKINGKVLYMAAITAYQGIESMDGSSEGFYGIYSSSSCDTKMGYPMHFYMHPNDYDVSLQWMPHRGYQIRPVFK